MSFLKKPMAAPSPTPSNASTTKRKRPTEPVVFSQPQDSGTGEHVYTRLTYTIDYLRQNQRWHTFEELMAYLNVPEGDIQREQLRMYFRSDNSTSRIAYNAANDTYRYKPKLDIRNPAQLKGYLQTQKSAQGLSIKELKDGWATVADDIKAMEEKKEVLVKHTKDGIPKTVWGNDPSLMHTIDPDFVGMWHKIGIPANPDDLRNTLASVGLKPATMARIPVDAGPKQKKKRAARRGGKITNTHMAGSLMDFSAMRR